MHAQLHALEDVRRSAHDVRKIVHFHTFICYHATAMIVPTLQHWTWQAELVGMHPFALSKSQMHRWQDRNARAPVHPEASVHHLEYT